MCLVHAFYCLDCQTYSKIPFRDPNSKIPANLVSNVVCFEDSCVRRARFCSSRDCGLDYQCFNPLCTEETCRVELIPKSCSGGWQGEPDCALPVQLEIRVSGTESFLKNTFVWLSIIENQSSVKKLFLFKDPDLTAGSKRQTTVPCIVTGICLYRNRGLSPSWLPLPPLVVPGGRRKTSSERAHSFFHKKMFLRRVLVSSLYFYHSKLQILSKIILFFEQREYTSLSSKRNVFSFINFW